MVRISETKLHCMHKHADLGSYSRWNCGSYTSAASINMTHTHVAVHKRTIKCVTRTYKNYDNEAFTVQKHKKPTDRTIFNIEHRLAQQNTFQMTLLTAAFCFPHGIAQEASNGPSAHLFPATIHNLYMANEMGCTLSTG